jgi:multiple sugar transport system substrate-binding protein
MADSKFNRRTFLKAAALTTGGAVLAACAPATSVAPVSEAPADQEMPVDAAPVVDPTAVNWWYAWGNLDAGVQKFSETEEFKQTMGSIKFEFKGSVPSEAILTAVAAGTPPDGGSNFDYPNLFYRGAVVPVNNYVEASQKIKRDDVLEKLWESSFYDGQMIGVPGIEGFLWWGLNVNIDAAEKAGLDINNLPTTWDEVFEWHKAMTIFDSAGNLQQFGLDPWDAMAGELDFPMQSFGGMNWWDEKTRKIDVNNEAMIKGLEVMGDFIKHVGPDKFAGMRQTQGMGGWGAAFNAGMQTMIMEGYWHPGETQIQQPDIAQFNRATWAPVPSDRKGKKIMATGAHFIQIFKDSKRKDDIFKFSELLFSDTFADILFTEVGWVFGRKSWLDKADPKAYPGLDFYIKAANETDEWLIGRRCPIHWYLASQYGELREKVFRGDMTAVQAAAELQTRAQNEWDAQGLT